jgi:hypothetical protein
VLTKRIFLPPGDHTGLKSTAGCLKRGAWVFFPSGDTRIVRGG